MLGISPNFIWKRFFGEARIPRKVDREDTKESPPQAADEVSVRTLRSYYAPNAVINGMFLRKKRCTRATSSLPVCCPAYIVEIAVYNATDRSDDEEPREVFTTAETCSEHLPNKVQCSGGGDLQLVRGGEQLEDAVLGPDANAKPVAITPFLVVQ